MSDQVPLPRLVHPVEPSPWATDEPEAAFPSDGQAGPARRGPYSSFEPESFETNAAPRRARRPLNIVVMTAITVVTVATAVIAFTLSRPHANPTAIDPPGALANGKASSSGSNDTGVAASTAAKVVPQSASDTDTSGFTVFGGGARCFNTDRALLFMRTGKSALVVCQSEVNRPYYRGYRISDGAKIDLYDVSRQVDGFIAFNDPDDARYVIDSTGFQLIQHGDVVTSEPAVEVGP